MYYPKIIKEKLFEEKRSGFLLNWKGYLEN